MKPENTVFIHGLWLNPKGLLANQISTFAEIIQVLGVKTMQERVNILVSHLNNNPSVENLVGHSAGCVVIAEAISQNRIPMTVKKIVLLNPAPLPGIMFTPFDKIYWAMPSYLKKLMTGENIGLSKKHTEKLLTLTSRQLEELGNTFAPESGVFTRFMVLNQWRASYKTLNIRNREITIINASKDDMVGRNTWKKVVRLFPGAKVIHIEGGHMKALLQFNTLVGKALKG